MGQTPCSMNTDGEEWVCPCTRQKHAMPDEYAMASPMDRQTFQGLGLEQKGSQGMQKSYEQLEAICDEILATAASQQKIRDSLDSLKPLAGDLEVVAWEKWLVAHKAARGYLFKVDGGQSHEVVLTHKENEWSLWLDGQVRKHMKHSGYTNCNASDNHNFRLREALRSGKPLDMTMKMNWSHALGEWQYTLTVNGVEVPERWRRGKPMCTGPIPEVPHLNAMS
mmetsp:Transcript_5868/g.14002  ORF Transcript_5868/g.14002 Transcript_5868/m.14002 type:complete len:223 (+) Transcript_5868:72-740(+)